MITLLPSYSTGSSTPSHQHYQHPPLPGVTIAQETLEQYPPPMNGSQPRKLYLTPLQLGYDCVVGNTFRCSHDNVSIQSGVCCVMRVVSHLPTLWLFTPGVGLANERDLLIFILTGLPLIPLPEISDQQLCVSSRIRAHLVTRLTILLRSYNSGTVPRTAAHDKVPQCRVMTRYWSTILR